MKRYYIILIPFFLLALTGNAQVSLNEKGLYQDKNGTLFTGSLEQIENGTKNILSVKDGMMEGEANYFYASGKLMETGNFEKGLKSGKWLRYNENGVTVGLAIFNAGKKNGTWIVWDDKGNKTFEMHYANGDKTGTWYNWDANGQLLSTKDFGSGN